MAETANAYASALSQLQRAAALIDLPPGVCQLLAQPKRELTAHFLTRMDEECPRIFIGYRGQRNTLRAPAKGGIRYHPVEER